MLALALVLLVPALAEEPIAPDVNAAQSQVSLDAPVPSPAMEAGDLPPELAPWVAWVLARHPDARCPVANGGLRVCAWPGEFTLAATESGGRFTLGVRLDRRTEVPLPGGGGAWPQAVRSGASALAVQDRGGLPVVALGPGEHVVSGTYVWPSLPQGIALPAGIGVVALTVGGEEVPWPRIEEGGTLRLGAGDAKGREANTLELEVSRRIADGVPVRVETRIAVRASGAGREEDLGAVLVANTKPVALSADLPARFTPEGNLVVQVRPGSFTVTFDALHDGPMASLAAPSLDGTWPETEFWAVAKDDRARAVNLTGPAGVDPARTTLPSEWRSLPAFAVKAGERLSFEELRRGEPEPAPNRLELQRELWLDTDGHGFTARDTFSGAMHREWRLDLRPPWVLGHVSDHGQDQVITAGTAGAGSEVRREDASVLAESRLEGRPASMAAVGWDADMTKLAATLHLPPGWTLIAAPGVDGVPGSVVDRWTLFDLFFVLVLSMAAGRLLGWKWGFVALVGLSLARHAHDAPAWSWVGLLVVEGLLRVVPAGKWQALFKAVRWVLVAGLFLILVPFAVREVRTGLFPVLDRESADFNAGSNAALPAAPPPPVGLLEMAGDELASAGSYSRRDARWEQKADKKANVGYRYLSMQVDPTAVVQTGPGVPEWRWKSHALSWSGPVDREHRMWLVLVGPRLNLLGVFLRVALFVVLALRIVTSGPAARLGAALSAAVPGVGLLVGALALAPSVARAAPSPELLAEMERRLTASPACAPTCATAASVDLRLAGDHLAISAEVHVASSDGASWPVPGPTSGWVPASVTVDGRPTVALARMSDGFLHVRLDPGVHAVRAEGALPPTDAIVLQFGLQPRRVAWAADGWTVDGVHADGTAERSVQLTRTMTSRTGAGEAGGGASANLAPWLEVRRKLDLGVPWRVETEVARVGGPADRPLSLRVPVLPGEAVTDESLRVEEGAVLVSIDRDQASVSWGSTLTESPSVALVAPSGVPWTEVWTVSCAPVWSCSSNGGPAPLVHVQDGVWSPSWRPWPGESVSIAVTRPDSVEGQTVTIDRAELEYTPGRRIGEGVLRLSVRTSRGGQQRVTLPSGARLQQVLAGGVALPIQAQDGVVGVPLQPGSQPIEIHWQQPHAPAFADRVPPVDLGAPAVNTTVRVHAPEERWVVALSGPMWGPVPLFWTWIVIVLVAAPLLARLPWAPLKTWQWAMLGLGMTQVPVFVPAVVVLWFLALGARAARPPTNWLRLLFVQIGLVFVTLGAFGCLYAAVHTGLLVQPDMQVEGNGSSDQDLIWFQDRVSGALPQPLIVSLPLWSWRVAMLLWALWLAASLVRWLPWAWKCFAAGGILKGPPRAGKGTEPATT